VRGVALAAGLLVAGLCGTRAAGAGLAVGDPAPDFSLRGSDGEVHSLAQLRGKRGVVLAWFPRAFTPG
jgi:peroxiredoxin Q/BCP